MIADAGGQMRSGRAGAALKSAIYDDLSPQPPRRTNMGALSPELCNLWLARAFNAHDVDAAAAMYHPEASIVQVDDVHGGTSIARGADGIRKTMAAYVGHKPHMDVFTHHTTAAGDFAMTRSQWLITGIDQDGRPVEVHHHGMEVHRRLPDGTWVIFLDHPFGDDPGWAVEGPPPHRLA
jgi:ketosteroid isomerase-like protein